MTPKKETCEFFNRYEAKYDRESKRFYYEVLEASQNQEVVEKSDKKKKLEVNPKVTLQLKI